MGWDKVHSCVARCIIAASDAGDSRFLKEIGVPAALKLTWSPPPEGDLMAQAAKAISSWPSGFFGEDGKRATEKMVNVISGGGREYSSFDTHPNNAFEIAKLVDANVFSESLISKRHVALANNLGLPASPALSGPQRFILKCDKVLAGRASLDRYFQSANQYLILMSKKGSLRPMASGLRAWGKFCDLLGEQHFPIAPARVAQFAGVCREEGTYGQYISHLKVACDLIKSPTRWYDDARVTRM